jgi:hypothetical protein
MPCLIVLFLFGLPRVALLFAWLLTDYTKSAFETRLWPLLGFFFMPYTTLCYMCAADATHHQITGGWAFLIVFGAFLDLVVTGSAKRKKRRRK